MSPPAKPGDYGWIKNVTPQSLSFCAPARGKSHVRNRFSYQFVFQLALRQMPQVFFRNTWKTRRALSSLSTALKPNVNIITGLAYQPGHFFDYTGPAFIIEVSFTDAFEVIPVPFTAPQWTAETPGAAGIVIYIRCTGYRGWRGVCSDRPSKSRFFFVRKDGKGLIFRPADWRPGNDTG